MTTRVTFLLFSSFLPIFPLLSLSPPVRLRLAQIVSINEFISIFVHNMTSSNQAGLLSDGSMKQKKLKVVIITMGGERQEILSKMFSSPSFRDDFDVEFSPGIHQRSIRNREGMLKYAYLAGVLPEKEWKTLEPIFSGKIKREHYDIDEILKSAGVEVGRGRRGSESDQALHYSVEFWRKAKTLAKQRSVMACTLAHLIAMKKAVEINADLILEDNVRACYKNCAERIRIAKDSVLRRKCDLLYFGWLGSLKNLNWVINTHAPQYTGSTFTFPSINTVQNEDRGSILWGAYAYHITPVGYNAIIKSLKQDVGGLLWKGKRMRSYMAKPIDKIMPRRVESAGLGIEVSKLPCFFRAPMLQSRIHAQWDQAFCESTDYQLKAKMLDLEGGWDDLFLTEVERQTVELAMKHGKW